MVARQRMDRLVRGRRTRLASGRRKGCQGVDEIVGREVGQRLARGEGSSYQIQP